MHPGPLASAGDGCFAGQGDSARLMLVFFERNHAVEMALFETMSSIIPICTYTYYISLQIAWCVCIVGSHHIWSTHFTHAGDSWSPGQGQGDRAIPREVLPGAP